MPRCYLLTICSGSSLDQQSNNVTLFNLVEQVNVRAGSRPPEGTLIPVEVHAYFSLDVQEIGGEFEVRFALVAATSGLESYSDVFVHRSNTARYRTRTLGLALPPMLGAHELRVEWRARPHGSWHRENLAWPINIAELEAARPRVTH